MRRFPFTPGPFHDSRCRLKDLADDNRMEMRNAFQYLPAFGVLLPRYLFGHCRRILKFRGGEANGDQCHRSPFGVLWRQQWPTSCPSQRIT